MDSADAVRHKTLLFDGDGWQIFRESAPLPDGRVKTMGRARRSDTVHVLAFTAAGNVLLLHEFRPHFQTAVWMLPSGKIDKEADPLVAAQRELREETGFRAATITPYCTSHHAEGLIWTSYIFLARDLTHDPLPQDATELIAVHELPIDDAVQRVLACSHVHTTSAYALLRYLREHGK